MNKNENKESFIETVHALGNGLIGLMTSNDVSTASSITFEKFVKYYVRPSQKNACTF